MTELHSDLNSNPVIIIITTTNNNNNFKMYLTNTFCVFGNHFQVANHFILQLVIMLMQLSMLSNKDKYLLYNSTFLPLCGKHGGLGNWKMFLMGPI